MKMKWKMPTRKVKIQIDPTKSWRLSAMNICQFSKEGLVTLCLIGLKTKEDRATVFLHELAHYIIWTNAWLLAHAAQFHPLLKYKEECLAWEIARELAEIAKITLSQWIIDDSLKGYRDSAKSFLSWSLEEKVKDEILARR